jgi:hypothetical protein
MAGNAFVFRSDLDKLKKFYRLLPKMHARAGINLSNTLAFKLRPEMLGEIQGSMTIRSPGFVRGSLRIKKASFKDRVAEVGSIRRDRFTGWEEQETGKRDERDRRQTLVARRSNWKNRVAPRMRLKPGRARFVRPSDEGLRNVSTDIPGFLKILERKKHRAPFYIPVRYKKLVRGIYIFRAKRVRRVQTLDARAKSISRNRWMTRSLRKINQPLVQREWNKAMTFQVERNKLLE